jgi:hypothetical protein
VTAPKRRAAFLAAEWRYLVMLNYDVEAAMLAPLVPRGTELDLWDGRALASVVGFRFLRTRVRGLAIPFHRDFEEVNLRFYVRRLAADGTERRGVVFVRELVPRAAIARLARAVYNEPYLSLPMRSTAPRAATDAPGRVSYEWRLGTEWSEVSASAVGAPSIPSPDSEAGFITEHYWGYTRQRDGGTVEYEVAHPPWRVWAAAAPLLEANVSALYGAGFATALAVAPRSSYIAEGSTVTVFRPRRIA